MLLIDRQWQSTMYAEGLPAEVRLKAVTTDGRPAQITAIGGIERSLAEQRLDRLLKRGGAAGSCSWSTATTQGGKGQL